MFLQDVVWLHISAAYDSTWGSCTNLSLGCVKHLCCHRKFIDQTKHSCVVLACCCRVRFVTTDLLHMMIDDWPSQKYQSEILIVVATQQIHETTNISWLKKHLSWDMFCLHGLISYDVRWLGATKIPIGNITLLLRYTKLLKSTNNVPWKMHLSWDVFCLHGLVGYDVRWLAATKVPIGYVTLLLRYTKLHKSTNILLWKMHLSWDVFCLHGLVGYDVGWLHATKIPIGNVNLTLLHNKFMKPQTFRVWKSTCRGMCSVFMDWLVVMLDNWVNQK